MILRLFSTSHVSRKKQVVIAISLSLAFLTLLTYTGIAIWGSVSDDCNDCDGSGCKQCHPPKDEECHDCDGLRCPKCLQLPKGREYDEYVEHWNRNFGKFPNLY